jgi:hypothetical protein
MQLRAGARRFAEHETGMRARKHALRTCSASTAASALVACGRLLLPLSLHALVAASAGAAPPPPRAATFTMAAKLAELKVMAGARALCCRLCAWPAASRGATCCWCCCGGLLTWRATRSASRTDMESRFTAAAVSWPTTGKGEGGAAAAGRTKRLGMSGLPWCCCWCCGSVAAAAWCCWCAPAGPPRVGVQATSSAESEFSAAESSCGTAQHVALPSGRSLC